MENEIMYIKLDDIIPNRFQPREIFDEDALNKLSESIKQHGVIEPILVRPVSNKYEIIAGERRYKASVLAGLTKIPAMIRQLDDKESSILAFIENQHRSDVSAIEEARTMDRILQSNNMTQEELGKELGMNQSTIANKLRLLNLPLEVQEALMRNEISERHARSLLSIKDENKQIELLKKIKEKRMTVRELDSEIKEMNNMNDNMNIYENNINSGMNEYLNNYSNPTPPMPSASTESMASNIGVESQEDPGFMDFLNNYDNNNPLPQEESTSVDNMVPNVGEEPTEDPGFMDFLNNYDNNNPLPQEEPTSVDNMVPNVGVEPTEDPGFMDFLNNYDNNNPLPQEESTSVDNMVPNVGVQPIGAVNGEIPTPPVSNTTSVQTPDIDFTNYLNNFNSSNNVEPTAPVVENNEPAAPGFMDYLNNFETSKVQPEQEPVVPSFTPIPEEPIEYPKMEEVPKEEPVGFNENIYSNVNETANNVYINDVTPPVTTDFSNQYVENNPNYVDVSKEVVIDNVDEIINKLKVVVDEIKQKSKFKIDTDEINYDDIYQITIKIDKRDF